jgi:thiol-disulfide isomerase/thioredoxin
MNHSADLMRIPGMYLSLIFLTLLGCSEQKEQEAAESTVPLPDQIVLIFDQCIQNGWYTWPDGSRSGFYPEFEVRYIDDDYITRHFMPRYAPERDTLVISTRRSRLEVQHAFKGVDKISFLLQKGDSVLFTYADSVPYATVLNRQVHPDELNYELLKREKITNGRLPGLVRMQPRFAFRDSAFYHIEDLPERVEAVKETGRNAALKEYQAEQKWLDQLSQQEFISAEAHAFYTQKRMYDIASLHVPQYNYKTKKKGAYPASLPLLSEGDQPLPTIEALMGSSADSLLSHFYYQELLRNFLEVYFLNKVPKVRTQNSSLPDYRQVYDSLRISQLVEGEVKAQLLFKTADYLFENAGANTIQAYWEMFKQDVPNPAYHSYLSQKYRLHVPLSNEMQLTSLAGQSADFGELLARHTGKLVYVDFWASWCAPCIRALPASHALQKDYKDQEVVFIYLSIDEDAAKWKAGAEKHQLLTNSYLIENRNTSTMLEELQLQSIPRYLLYDRQGNLVHKNAPGPDGDEVRKLLQAYLKD